MFDVLISGAQVVDGTGRPRYRADIGISRGKISAIGNLEKAEAKTVLNASGKIVCPGFIDMHSHSDLSILAHRRAASSLVQGITTEVVGSCGWSMAPVKDETKTSVLERLITGLIDKESFESTSFAWHSFGEFMDRAEQEGIGVNIVPQVGQSLIRAHVVGSANRPATKGEIEAMKALVADAMQAGAWGMSAGRSYRPGGFAPTSEIIELARVVGRYGGVYANHMKSEGDDLFGAVEEVVTIAREAEVQAEISHHKAVGKKNFGKVHKSLEMIEEARRSGLAINVDLYPYEFAQVCFLIHLLPVEIWDELQAKTGKPRATSALPSRDEIESYLKNKAAMEKLLQLPSVQKALERLSGYMMINAPSCPEIEGRIIGEYIAEHKLDPVRFMAELIQKDTTSLHAAWPINPDDVRTVASASFASVGTDAFTLDRPLNETPIHPRHYGTFPRVIGRFVKEDNLFGLEEAVRKCTSFPAAVMGIPQRGEIKERYWADLVVFDEATLMDQATAKEPYKEPAGIDYVLVNGHVALEKGKVKPVYAGKVLRKR